MLHSLPGIKVVEVDHTGATGHGGRHRGTVSVRRCDYSVDFNGWQEATIPGHNDAEKRETSGEVSQERAGGWMAGCSGREVGKCSIAPV
jgi:hypothetical protein